MVALEACHNWGMLYDVLSDLGLEVRVCHAREARLIGMASVKTDRIDALRLATLLRADLLPQAYVPSGGTRQLRDLVRSRAGMRRVGTRIKNQIHATLASNWIRHPYSDLFGKAGREFLQNAPLDGCRKRVVLCRLGVLDAVDEQISVLEAEIKRRAHLDFRAMLLTTVPGIGEFTALIVLAEIGEIGRFARAECLVNFAGLHPREDSSGEKIRRNRITKEGSGWLRWVLVEAAQHAVRHDGKIRDLYLRVLAKKGHNKAIVAAARELLVSIYWMLVRMEPYRPSGKRESAAITSEVR
jgi:transposase